MECRICGNTANNKKIVLKGFLYGTNEQFDYFRCSKCGCLQISGIVDDIENYYSSDYYSYNLNARGYKNALLYYEMKSQIYKKNCLGCIVHAMYPVDYTFYNLLDSKEARILDVGCGDGEMLHWLKNLGYNSIEGIDPYIDNDIVYDDGVRVTKKDLLSFEPECKYDMITFIHSLEHIYYQKEIISKVDEILNIGGFISIQLPVFSEYCWDKYKDSSYTLDPPRHLYIHTVKSLQTLIDSYKYEMVYFNSEYDVAIPIFAKEYKRGNKVISVTIPVIKGILVAITSVGIKRKLKKEQDGPIGTIVFRKKY